MEVRLSDTDRAVYEFIKNQLEEGYAPTIREICLEFNMKSTSSAHRSINKLAQAGLIEKGEGRFRALRLTGRNGMRIPVMGTVTAGTPITAIEYISDYISFQPDRNYTNPLFALNVRGDSMINIGILDGDLVIVEKTSYAENGDIVVALVDDEDATVKRFFKEDGRYRLQPENDFMEPIYSDNVSIIGKVVAVVRYL